MKEQTMRGSIYAESGEELAYTDTEDSGAENRVYNYGSTIFTC